MKLSQFKVLTFDCYGTLIDWESGMVEALKPLTSRVTPALTRNQSSKRTRATRRRRSATRPRGVIASCCPWSKAIGGGMGRRRGVGGMPGLRTICRQLASLPGFRGRAAVPEEALQAGDPLERRQ